MSIFFFFSLILSYLLVRSLSSDLSFALFFFFFFFDQFDRCFKSGATRGDFKYTFSSLCVSSSRILKLKEIEIFVHGKVCWSTMRKLLNRLHHFSNSC